MWAGGSGQRRRAEIPPGHRGPGSPRASAVESGVVPGNPRDHPVLWSSACCSLPEVKECQQGRRRCSGTACGAPDRLPGRRCISRLRQKSASDLTAAPGKGSSPGKGSAPGTSRARFPRSCRQVSCTAGHSPSWLPYPQWWDMVRSPALSAETVTAP